MPRGLPGSLEDCPELTVGVQPLSGRYSAELGDEVLRKVPLSDIIFLVIASIAATFRVQLKNFLDFPY